MASRRHALLLGVFLAPKVRDCCWLLALVLLCCMRGHMACAASTAPLPTKLCRACADGTHRCRLEDEDALPRHSSVSRFLACSHVVTADVARMVWNRKRITAIRCRSAAFLWKSCIAGIEPASGASAGWRTLAGAVAFPLLSSRRRK